VVKRNVESLNGGSDWNIKAAGRENWRIEYVAEWP